MTDYKKIFNLKNKLAFVVGGFGLIGKEIVKALKESGANVVILDYIKKSKKDASYAYFNCADIKNLSSMIQNPYANLQVATKSAAIQAEEADMALATSLNTLTQTGAGAGGATALAMAALRSKQGISASIEQQEADNSRLRAQGQGQMQQMLLSEASRVQQARVQGKQFVFGAHEQRDIMDLNRQQSLMQQNQQIAASAQQAQIGAISSFGGSVSGALIGMG